MVIEWREKYVLENIRGRMVKIKWGGWGIGEERRGKKYRYVVQRRSS